MNVQPDYIPEIRPAEYEYTLPDDRIAVRPAAQRDESRLLLCDARSRDIAHRRFGDLPRLIPPGATLVVNDTRVVRARLHLYRESGGKVEVLLTDPLSPSSDPAVALAARGESVWRCMVGGLKKIRNGGEIRAPFPLALPEETSEREKKKKEGREEREEGKDAGRKGEPPAAEGIGHGMLYARLKEEDEAGPVLRFRWTPAEMSFAEVIERAGHVPLPPYIKRRDLPEDVSSYQTVYAEREGAVAAPTAGLHFTPDVLERIAARDIRTVRVTLHVGAGTFAPMKGERVGEHPMHAERIAVSEAALHSLLEAAGRRERTGAPLVVVGTTSLRTLESLYWYGVRLLRNEIDSSSSEPVVDQWDPYRLEREGALPSLREALQQVANRVASGGGGDNRDGVSGVTRLMIVPGYRFRACDALITNFHQPGSTLVLLVAAFLGKDLWRRAYDTALQEGYRFLSYGDSSLLIGPDATGWGGTDHGKIPGGATNGEGDT